MTGWRRLAIVVATAVGCSNLTDAGDGIAALQVRLPDPSTIEVGQAIQLTAQVLDKDGATISVPVAWRTPDSATLSVVPETGVVTGVSPGSGRVQATAGTFVSEFVTITVVPPAVAPPAQRGGEIR